MIIKNKIKKGVPTLIGVATIKAHTGDELSSSGNSKRFVTRPRLSKKASKNIIAKFLSLKKDDDGNIIEYKFNIIYTSTGRLTKNSVNLKWNYKTENIPSAVISVVNKLISGPSTISKNGETRRITIQGDPGAEFAVAVNESFIEDHIDGGEVLKTLVNKSEDISILRKPSFKTSDLYGKDVGVLKGVIPKSGRFSFSQDFPSNIIKRTKTTHAISSADVMKCDSDGLKIGDRLITGNASITGGTNAIKIENINSDSQITLDTVISSLPQYSSIHFTRNRNFSVDLIPELTPNINDSIPVGEKAVLSRQYDDPILTLTNVATNVALNGGSVGADHITKLSGRAISTPKSDNVIRVKLVITRGSSFTSVNIPKFDAYGGESWFTNTNVKENGGTLMQLLAFTFSGIGSSTVTLNYELKVLQWGSKDVNVALDLDNPGDTTRQVIQF